MGSRSYFKPSKIPLKYETRLSWYAFSFEVHTCIIASRVSTTKCPSAGERLSEIVDKQTRHCGVQRGRFDGHREILERPGNSLASLDLENYNFVLRANEELPFAALLSIHSMILCEYLAQVILLTARKSTSLFNSDI